MKNVANFVLRVKTHLAPEEDLLPKLTELSVYDSKKEGADLYFGVLPLLNSSLVKFCATPPSIACAITTLMHMQLLCKIIQDITLVTPAFDYTPMLANFTHLRVIECIFREDVELVDSSFRVFGSLPYLRRWSTNALFQSTSFHNQRNQTDHATPFFPVLEELEFRGVRSGRTCAVFLASVQSSLLRAIVIHHDSKFLYDMRELCVALSGHTALQSLELSEGPGFSTNAPAQLVLPLSQLKNLRNVTFKDVISPSYVTDDFIRRLTVHWRLLEAFKYSSIGWARVSINAPLKLTVGVLPILAAHCPLLAHLRLAIDWKVLPPVDNLTNRTALAPRRDLPLELEILYPGTLGEARAGQEGTVHMWKLAEFLSDVYPNIRVKFSMFPTTGAGVKSAWKDIKEWIDVFNRVRRMQEQRSAAELALILDH